MNANRSTRFARTWSMICALASTLVVGVRQASSQSQPATIPTLVAQAMSLQATMFGRPQFFDGRTPTDWPAALIPSGVKVLGGGIIGDSAMYRMRVAVFEFPPQANPHALIEDLVTRAGYAHLASQATHPRDGGFAETVPLTPRAPHCKGGTVAIFDAVDSARAPTVFAIVLVDGEAGRQNCSLRDNFAFEHRFPVAVPTLSPPAGAISYDAGSGWSGTTGEMRSTVRTTMPADSVLGHYSAQLVAGGWRAAGRPATVDGTGVQRFSFRDGQDTWTAALIVTAVGDRRQILLQLSKND